MKKFENLLRNVFSMLWFLPTIIVVGLVVLAAVLIKIDTTTNITSWSHIFGVSSEGSRGMLTAISSSMITVAGVVFSITIVALSLASSQYSSRVLRKFMKDKMNQSVLGVFVGIYAYCLIVLRTIRGPEEGPFIPSIAIFAGILLAFIGIGFLVYFIHHAAASIQAAHIIAAIAAETNDTIERIYPEKLNDNENEKINKELINSTSQWNPVVSLKTGYIQQIDIDKMKSYAQENKMIICMQYGVGEFIIEGINIATINYNKQTDKKMTDHINSFYSINRQRSMNQDISFGIRQIVDVALKSLSPGINDITTAVMCVNYLTAINFRILNRKIVNPFQQGKDGLPVIAKGPTFESYVNESFSQIRRNSEGNVTMLTKLLQSLELLISNAPSDYRRAVLVFEAEAVKKIIERSVSSPYERAELESNINKIFR